MKTLVLATAASALMALSSAAFADQFVTDPLLKDFASSGQIISTHGYSGGR